MARTATGKIWLMGFIIGVCAMMAFHQGFLHVLHHHAAKLPMLTESFGRFPPAFDVSAAAPHGLPMLAVLALWGGIWGIIIATVVRLTRIGQFDLPLGLIFGAIAITAAQTTPLPGMIGLPRLDSDNEQALLRAVLLNGAFGFGVVFLMRPFALRG